ncbi:MAG: hypothetical protein IPO83_01890 [Chitinophagaceae bacterium]|nr:hypothetical protein [Chitinophagaceae bacterium]
MKTYPENDFDLNFSIETVKKVLEMLLRTPGHINVEINQMLSTYKFAYGVGLYAGIINIQLSSIDDQKTKLHISTMPAVGGNSDPAILLKIQNKFLDSLTGYLSGSLSIEKLAEKAKAGKGCLLLLFGILLTTAVLSAFAFSMI